MASEAQERAEAYYAKVRAKVETKGMGVVKAFKAVAREEKVSEGTIQSHYYRVARERGTTRAAVAQDRRLRAKEFSTAGPDRLLNDIMGAVQELVRENRELKQDKARLEAIADIFSQTNN